MRSVAASCTSAMRVKKIRTIRVSLPACTFSEWSSLSADLVFFLIINLVVDADSLEWNGEELKGQKWLDLILCQMNMKW